MRHTKYIKGLGAVLAALAMALLTGDRAQALNPAGGDYLDVTFVQEDAGATVLGSVCTGACDETNAPAASRISTTGYTLTLQGLIAPSSGTPKLDVGCYVASLPCLSFDIVSGDGGYQSTQGVTASPFLFSNNFSISYDFSTGVVVGDSRFTMAVRVYQDVAKTTLRTTEYFVVEFQDPTSAEPVVCFTNMPDVNELGRRTTRNSSFAATGRVEPRQSGTAVPNPIASQWVGTCGMAVSGANDKLANIQLSVDGGAGATFSSDVPGSAAGCSEPVPPTSTTTACDDQGGAHYQSGTFTMGSVSLSSGAATTLSLQAQNDAGLMSTGGQRFAGGLRDAFDLYLDNSPPTLGGGNFTVLEPDLSTRQNFNAATPITVSAAVGDTTVNLFGTMADADPGRIAYAGYQYSSNAAVSNVNAQNGEIVVSIEDYKAFTDDGRATMKAGDYVHFDSASANPNNGMNFRIHTISERTIGIAGEAALTHAGIASVGPFNGSLAFDMISKDGAFSIQNETTAEICTDGDFDGVLTCGSGGTGTIDYRTGAFSVTWNAGLANGDSILANYSRIYAFTLDLSGNSYLGSPSLPGEQVNQIRVIQVLNSTAYQVVVNGQTYGITSDGSATDEEIATALAACLTTPATCSAPPVDQGVVGYPVKDIDGNLSVIQIEPATLGDTFDLSIAGGSTARMQFVARSIEGVALEDGEQIVDIAVPAVQANTLYTVTINGNDYTIDSGAGPTDMTILQALSDCISVPAANCVNVPPAPVGISLSGPAASRLTIADSTPGSAPSSGFTVSVSTNLVAAPDGATYIVRRSAYAALRAVSVAGSGVIDFNDASGMSARAFDTMLTRGALATGAGSGDWVLFASNDARNANRRFRILAVNTGARTITVSTTSVGGQNLDINYASATPKAFVIRDSSGRVDGDDAALGYGCGRCNGDVWAVDLDLRQGGKLFDMSVFDDAGNKQTTPWAADVSYDPIIVTADPPTLFIDRVWLYPDVAAAMGDTNANASPANACDPDGGGAGVYNGNACSAQVNPGCHEMSLDPDPVGSGPLATGDTMASWSTVVIPGDLISTLALSESDSFISSAFASQVPVPILSASFGGGNTTITIPTTTTTSMTGDYDILRAQPMLDRVVGQCTGVKVVGRIVLDSDPSVPAYPGGQVPAFTFADTDLSANVIHDPAFGDGKHFIWFADADVPSEYKIPDETIIPRTNAIPATPDVWDYVDGTAMVTTGCAALPASTVTSRVTVLGENLVSAAGVGANDEVVLQTTDGTFGPYPVICARVAGSDTVIEFQQTTITGDPIEYWVPRSAAQALTTYNILVQQDNVSNEPTVAGTTGFDLDRTAPSMGLSGFVEDQRNVNFAPSVGISDAHLALAPPAVNAGGNDLDLTNPGQWSLATGTNSDDCVSSTTATQITLLGQSVAGSIDPVTDMVVFETNGGTFGPTPVLNAANSAGNTIITIGETCINAGPSVASHNVRVVRPSTRIRLFRATDLASNVSRLEVDIDAITNDPTGGDAFGVPLVLEGEDATCDDIGPIPDPQCDGVPVAPIPVCRSSFYTLPNNYNPPRTCDDPPACTVGGQYPYRVMCEMPITTYNAFNNVILGNDEDERGSYRFEIYAADTAVPPNVLAYPSAAGDTGPIDLHFSAIITDSQAFINDFVLIFLNEGGSELNPLDLCPPDLQGDPQSLFECLIDPAVTVLSDNPTDVREGESALGFFFEAMAFVIGSPEGTTTTGSDDAAFNSMAQTALNAFEQLFPSLFNDGAVDSDIATFLNLLKNGIDRRIFDELTTITISALIDPDNDALTPDGIESLEPLVQHIMQNDGGGFRVAINDDGSSSLGIQDKSSSPFIRLTPAILDLLSYEDFRGTIDVANELRFLSVPQINELGTITLEQRPAMPLLYGVFEALYDGFDPLLLVDTVKGTSAVVYDAPGDGEQNANTETRCYEAFSASATGPTAYYVGDPGPRPTTPTDCYCVADGGVVPDGPLCTQFGLDPDTTVVDPFSDSRHFARTLRLLSNDNCASITNGNDKTECLDFVQNGVAPTYQDPRSEIYEGNSLDNIRWIAHQILDSQNPPGVAGISTLTSLLDLVLCAFEPVRSGQIQRESPMDRIFPVLAALINQTGSRDQAECSTGGQFLATRLDDVECQGNGWAPVDGDNVGPVRLMQGARGIECPQGERIRLDINSLGLAPGEYCNAGELIFPEDDAFSSLLPAMETLTDPYVLDEVNRVLTEFPDVDVILEGLVASSDQGLLNRTLITFATILDNFDNGQRSSVLECGTPGAPVGGCREPSQPMAEILLDGIADQLLSARAPLVTCSAGGSLTCESNPLPGDTINSASHPGCKTEGQKVFCDAENLPIAVFLSTFDDLFVNNPPAGCDFYLNGTGGDSAGEHASCVSLQALDFDQANSIWDFLDDFVNEQLGQADRDRVMEMLPNQMTTHQKAATSVPTLANPFRFVPGPRPLITTSVSGDPEGIPPLQGSQADARVWPPDRAFPSPLVDCNPGGAPRFMASGTANTCWLPGNVLPVSMPGRANGRNPYDRYICDNFNCGGCGGQTAGGVGVGPGTAAATNQTMCAAKLTQQLKNPYFGCWKTGAREWAWNMDVLFMDTEGIPLTPADCFDAPDLSRNLDEAALTAFGIDLFVNLLGLLPVDGNALLSTVSGFTDPDYFPSTNLTYKTFGMGASVPKAELLTLFASLRASRALLANPLIGDAMVFRETCTGFVAAESGSVTVSNTDRRMLANVIDRTPAVEPLIKDDAFDALQAMLRALVSIQNRQESDVEDGLFQSQCPVAPESGVPADIVPVGHATNPFSAPQLVWGQGPILLQFLSTFEETGYAQSAIFSLMSGLEFGPSREALDGVFEVLGDWREVTSDLDSRIPPGKNFMRVVLDGVDNLISPRDGTTVPCGNDGRPCSLGSTADPLGRDKKNFFKDGGEGDIDGLNGRGPTDAEPFLYPLFPTMLNIGGVKLSANNAIIKRCREADWSFVEGLETKGCTTENGYGLLIPELSTTFADSCTNDGVCDCDAVNNGGVCPDGARADFVYVTCMGGDTENCDPTDLGGEVVPGLGGPSENYSYLGHKFQVVQRVSCLAQDGLASTCLVLAHEAFDSPVITIDQTAAVSRKADFRIHTYVRATGTQGLRAIGKAIVDDFNQDPDIPGVDIFEVDEVIADLIRCDTDGFLIDSVLSFLDDRTPIDPDAPNGDLRALRNAIFTLNANTTTRDAQLDIIGSTLGATGGAEISYSDTSNHPDPTSCTPLTPPRGLCAGDAPLTGLNPILREGAVVDPLEQFALQESLDNLLNPFNQTSNSRLSEDPSQCTGPGSTNGYGIPNPECVAFVDPILEAIVDASSNVTTDRSSGNDSKIAEVLSEGWDVPKPETTQIDPLLHDSLTGFRGQLAQLNNGGGVTGLDSYTSAAGNNGDCDFGPNRPDGILDDCNGNDIPDFLARLDDGTPDGFYNGGGNADFMVGHYYYNDTGKTVTITSVSFYHDGVAGKTVVTNDPARVGRARVLSTSASFAAPANYPNWTVGTAGLQACMFATVDQSSCMGGEMQVHDFYFRDREGMQTVPIYPPVDVPAGRYAVVTIQQPTPNANPFGIAVDTRAYTTWNEIIKNPVNYTPPDFYSDLGVSNPAMGRLKKLSNGLTGINAVPIMRVGYATPITMAETDAPFESALALFRRMFNKPSPFSPAPSNNPERRRPIEPLADALVALALPIDVAPKNQINNDLAIPANCERVQGASGKADFFVFLPHITEPNGTLRRQKCDYPGGAETPDEMEMEAGLGCYDPDGTNPDGVPCWATPRGIVPADLDDSRDFVTPLELNLPLFKRLLLATYPDPIPNDPLCPAEAVPGPGDGLDCIDPDMVMVDTLNFFELLMSPVPPLSCAETNALGGDCDEATAVVNRNGAMTSLIDRLLVLPKILVEASNDPAQWRYRFFEHPADASCSGVPDPDAKCDATSANILTILSGLATPVTLYDRVTGLTDPEPRPILIRLLDRYTTAFFPDNLTPPTLPPQTLQSRISLDPIETEVIVREGYGVGGPTDCTSTDPDTGNPISLPECKYFLDLTVNHGQLAGVEKTINEQQLVSFSAVPVAGNWTLTYNGAEETVQMPYTANAQAVANALNGLVSLSAVDVVGDYTDGFTVSFNGVNGGIDHPQLTATSYGLGVTITPSTVCDFDTPCIIGGSQPLAGAVVSVSFPQDVGAGKDNALHAAAFHSSGEIGDSLLMLKVADGDQMGGAYTVQDGDVLEYGMLVPSISHVRNVGVNMIFNRANDAACTSGGNSVTQPETIRLFDSLSLTQQACLQEASLRFGTATDQLSRPADTSIEIEGASDTYIIRQIDLTDGGPNKVSYVGQTIPTGAGNVAGVYIEFNTVEGAPQGRAEAYFSYIKITREAAPDILIYDGGSSVPAALDVWQNRGYSPIDEINTVSAGGSITYDTRVNSILCPTGGVDNMCPDTSVVAACMGAPTAPAYSNYFAAMTGSEVIGERGCDSATDGAIRIRTDAFGHARIPVLASQIPFSDRIQVQVRCGNIDGDVDCEEQDLNSPVEVEVRKGGDSAPVVFTAVTRYPPRPMSMEFESRDQGTRPVYQTVAIDDPDLTNVKSGEPAQDDTFFLDTRILDQRGDPFTGFIRTDLAFEDEPILLDYAVVSRPALHLDINATSTSSLTVIGTGAERSTGPLITQQGDYLEYEVYFEPGDINDNVGIDIQSADPEGGSLDLRLAAIPGMPAPLGADTTLLASTGIGGNVGGTVAAEGRSLDQNLRPAHPGTDLRGQGTPAADDNFYYRRIPIPAGFVLSKDDAGSTVATSSRVFAALWDTDGTSATDVWYRNIRIGNGGSSKYEIYDQDTGRRPMTLSGSPCNDKTGGSPGCPSSITSLTCPGGGTDYVFVFDGFTGLDVESTTNGDLVMMLNRAQAATLTNPIDNTFVGENAHYTSDTRLRACNVTQDPAVVFEVSAGAAPATDFRDGLAIFVANQGGSFGGETNRVVSSTAAAGGSVAMCADTRYGNNCAAGGQLGEAVGEGRFCTSGAGASQYGQRCTDGLMRTVHNDSVDTYTAGRSHVVQRAKRVAVVDGGDGSLYRHTYTMGVSSGRQTVEARTEKPAAGNYHAETVPYVDLLPTQSFVQYGNPPPVPAEIIFDSAFDEEPYNGTIGAPGSFADLHVQLLDQYGSPWQNVWPLKWEITAPKNAIRMRGTANSQEAAYMGLKLNTGLTARPRWYYPLTNGNIPHSNDVDIHTGAGQVGLGRLQLANTAENNDGDKLIQFTTTTTGLLPGDTLRIGMTETDTVTAVVANVYGAYVEVTDIRYLGGECDYAGMRWGYSSATGADANLMPNMTIPADREASNSADTGITGSGCTPQTFDHRNYTVYVTNPTTAGDDFPCNETDGPGEGASGDNDPTDDSPPRCERPGDNGETEGSDRWNSKYNTCQGGNFDRGADGTWRDVITYKTDDSQTDNNGATETERQCFELNFAPGTGYNPNGGTFYGVQGGSPPQVSRDTPIGDTRFNYGAYMEGIINAATDGYDGRINGHCDYNNTYVNDLLGDTGVGALAWNCIPGSMRFDMLVPTVVDNDPSSGEPSGHVGVDFAGLFESGQHRNVNFSVTIVALGIPITLNGTLEQPYRSRISNMANSMTTSSFIGPAVSKIQAGATQPPGRTSVTPLTIWGEAEPEGNDGAYASEGPWDIGSILQFDALAKDGDGNYGFAGVDSFATRVLAMPRSAMYFANETDGGTVARVVCNGASHAANPNFSCTNGSGYQPYIGLAPYTGRALYARQGIWMAMAEGTLNNVSTADPSNPRDSEFYLRSLEMNSTNDSATVITADVEASLLGIPTNVVLPQIAVIPNFVNHKYYDGGSLLPSTSVSNYARIATTQQLPDGTDDNTNAFINPDIRIAGGQAKICATSDVTVVLPVPLSDEAPLDDEYAMTGCPYTTTGQSRPGSFAVARVNDPMNGDGKMYGRLYFPPWPNETVELSVSAPGVPPLIYQRNIVRGATAGTGADVNQRPIALDPPPPQAIGDPPTVYPAEFPVSTPILLTGTDDGPVTSLVVNADTTGLQGSLNITNGTAPLTVQYTPPNGFTGATSFSFTVTDRNGAGAISFPQVVDIFVVDPNKRPVATPAGPINGTEDVNTGNFNLTGTIGVAGVGPLEVEVTTPPASGRICSGGGCATELIPGVTVAAPASVYYDNDANFCGMDTFEFVVRDTGVIPPAKVPSLPVSVTVNISCVNDAPSWVNVPTMDVFEDVPFPMGMVIQEVDDTGTNNLRVTIAAVNGVFTLGSLTGISFNSGADGTANMVIEGSINNLNNAISAGTYTSTPLNYNDASVVQRLSMTVNDLGNSGSGAAMQATQNFSFAIKASNDPPTLTGGPASLVTLEDIERTEGGTACFSPGFTVGDAVDNHNQDMQVTLSVTSGNIRLVSVGAVTFISGDGSWSNAMTFRGTAAELNAVLAANNICYEGLPNFAGSDNLNVNINDLGNVDANFEALSATLQIPITVTPIDDAPAARIDEPSLGDMAALPDAGQNWSAAPGGGLDILPYPTYLTDNSSPVGVDAPISAVTVSLYVNGGCAGGQWVQDFEAWLDHPDGIHSVLLVFQRGGNDTTGMNPTTFDQAAAETITALARDPNSGDPGTPLTGTYRPESGGAGLDSLVGLSSLGTWKLRIRDNSGYCYSQTQPGKLVAWNLNITTQSDAVVIAPGVDLDLRATCLDVEGDPVTLHSWNSRGTKIPFGGTAVAVGMFTPLGCRSTLAGSDGAGCPDWSVEDPSDASPAGPYTPDTQGLSSITYPLTYECDAGGKMSNVAQKDITIVNTPPSVLITSPNPNAPQNSGQLGSFGSFTISNDNNNNYQGDNSSTIAFIGTPQINSSGIDLRVITSGGQPGDTRFRLRSPAGTWVEVWSRGAHGGGDKTLTNLGSWDGQNPNGTWRLEADDNDCHPNLTGACQDGTGSVTAWYLTIRYSDTAGTEIITLGDTRNFTAICTDPDGHTPLTYNWNFNDTGVNPPVCTYPAAPCNQLSPGNVAVRNEGTRTITLTCSDSYGLGSVASVNLQANNAAPNSTITAPTLQTTTINNNSSIAISNNTITRDTTGGPNAFPADVNVRVQINHNYDADLDISVTHGGTTRDMSSDNGGSGDNYNITTFNDGSGSVTGGGAPFNGTYGPEQSLSVYNAINASGTWRLTVTDDLTHDGGCSGSCGTLCTIEDNCGTFYNFWVDIAHGPVISAGGSVNFQGTCTDSDGAFSNPLTLNWTFNTVTGGPAPAPTSGNNINVVFNNVGRYTATLTCTDVHNKSDPTPATTTFEITVN